MPDLGINNEIFCMNKLYFPTKQFFISLFFIYIFFIPQTTTYSSQLQSENVNSPIVDVPSVKTTATPHRIPGNMRFRHEMAEFLEEKVGADDSGDVYKTGGLASYYTGPGELFPGKGRLGHLYKFLPVIRWYDPAYYFNSDVFHPGSTVTGEYTHEQCVTCHRGESQGIVTQWKQSKHGTPSEGKEVVGCDRWSWEES